MSEMTTTELPEPIDMDALSSYVVVGVHGKTGKTIVLVSSNTNYSDLCNFAGQIQGQLVMQSVSLAAMQKEGGRGQGV